MTPTRPNRDHAFVIQFHPDASSFAGTVEHVASGRSARFHTPAELFAFLEGVRRERVKPEHVG